uniref:Uncharacterized protein n=1 Tax=Rhizophora mucronata TaxID=61149 RepID=A0A2P2PCE4_RHIMU
MMQLHITIRLGIQRLMGLYCRWMCLLMLKLLVHVSTVLRKLLSIRTSPYHAHLMRCLFLLSY